MKELTKAEEQVMQALWKIERGFAKDVVENIQFTDKKPAYNTVLTILRILVDKQFVKYETYGKANLYIPVYSKEEYSKFSIDGVVSRYFQGSAKSMLSFLVKDKSIDLKDLEEILDKLKK